MCRTSEGTVNVHRDRDRGETLVEILFAVVIIGISVSALVSGLATAANAAIAQRDGATTDTALRNMAEAAKTAASVCTDGDPLAPDFELPDGWAASIAPAGATCPVPGLPLRLIVTATGPDGRSSSLDVVVRSP
jgi:type II secretory pathway pseudopilin PulG